MSKPGATTRRTKLLYHSDNDSFAGCEQMLVVLLNGVDGAQDVEAALTFRFSAKYAAEARDRLPANARLLGLRLPDDWRIRAAVTRRVRRPAARKVLKALTYAFPFRQLCQVWDIGRLYRLFRREEPDLVHVNNGGYPGAASCNAAAVAAALAGIPVVYRVHNIAFDYGDPRRWADYPLDRLVARNVDQFVTGSTAAARALIGVLRLPPGKARAIPNGIDVRPPTESVEATRDRLQARDAFVLLSVGSLERRKGQRYLLDAVHSLREASRLENAVVVCAGSGPDSSALQEQARRLGVSNHVHFVGYQNNVSNLFQAADVVIVPSIDREDFPNVVLEAMAFGKPAIGSRVAGIPEQIIDGVTGILVPPGDSRALADAIGSLEDAERRSAMGSAGRSRFEAEFTPMEAWKRYAELYAEVTEQRSDGRKVGPVRLGHGSSRPRPAGEGQRDE